MTVRGGIEFSVLLGLSSVGCGVPVGSLAHPALPLERARPFIAANSGAVVANNGQRASQDLPPTVGTPSFAASVDLGIDGRSSAGIGVGLLPINSETRYFLVTMRGERRSLRWPNLAGFMQIPLSFFDGPAPPPNRPPAPTPPWLEAFPLFGARYYLQGEHLSFVLSQGFGVTLVSVTTPGSLAADMRWEKLHILPELRWDLVCNSLEKVPCALTATAMASIGWRF